MFFMIQSGPSHANKGNCSGRNNNCGAHAFAHRFIKNLMNGQLDGHLADPNYQLLLETFKKIHDIPAISNLNWNHIKQLCCYYTHPYDREIVFGDVLREFFGEINAKDETYKDRRKEHFITIITSQIKTLNNLSRKIALPLSLEAINYFGLISRAYSLLSQTKTQPLQPEDDMVDQEFYMHNQSIQAFIFEMSTLFNALATNEPDRFDFLERDINGGFYNKVEVAEKINAFWNTTGFEAWINYIKTPYIYLPIDVLMNGAAALDFDVEIEIAGGHTWHNKIQNLDGSFTPRPFSLKAFNLQGIHYEVDLDSELETRVHNAQFNGFGIFEEGERQDGFLNQLGIQTGKVQGRKIRKDDLPSPEIRQFLRTLPVSDQDQASWIASFNTQGRADRSKPRSKRKTVKSAYLSIIEWAQFEVSLYQQVQDNPAWVSAWHRALYDLSQIKDSPTLHAWCTTHLRPLNPFSTLPQETLIGWACENTRLHADFDPLLGERRQAQPGKTISEAAWAEEQIVKGNTLSTLLFIYDQAQPAEKKGAYDLIFEEWQKHNAHTLDLWMSYKERPVAYALDAAERILNLALDLENYLPESEWPDADFLEQCVLTNNLLALYAERQRLYAYQFSPPPASSIPMHSTLDQTNNLLEQPIGTKRNDIDSRASTVIDESHRDKKKRRQDFQ